MPVALQGEQNGHGNHEQIGEANNFEIPETVGQKTADEVADHAEGAEAGQRYGPGGFGLSEDMYPVERDKGVEPHEEHGTGDDGHRQPGKFFPVVLSCAWRVGVGLLGGFRGPCG